MLPVSAAIGQGGGDSSASGLPLAGCSFAWLHQRPLADALRCLAEHGLCALELTTAPPHLSPHLLGPYERQELRALLASLDLRPLALNPTYLDLNLVSTNQEIREVSERQLMANVELAAELGAAFVVVLPGRRHQLAPAPDPSARAVFGRALERLLRRAEALGVCLALENSPYGYLGRSGDLRELAEAWNRPSLRIAYDVANALAVEDPVEGVTALAPHLGLAHVSDTWRNRWAHTSIGRGEVDFEGFAAALRRVGFTGPTVYELADGEDPEPRLEADLDRLERAGWSRAAMRDFRR